MDFDEYEYLEKAVDKPEILKEKDRSAPRHHRHREDNVAKRSRTDEKNGDKGERDRSDRRDRGDRDRHRSGGRDGEEHRSRDKDRKERDRDREKEKEREIERRQNGKDGEKESERVRVKERSKERELEREIKERENRKFKDKKELMELEVDPERDQRTVFAYQMPLKATERDVYEFFSKVGKVRDVRLIMDRNSRRSKGVGYVEFYDAMVVPQAIALSGQLLLGQPVMVKPSEAEKNLVQSTTTGAASVIGAERKLYVGNLHFNITEEQLRQIFEPFGAVELVQLPLDIETGHCRGYGFIQFAHVEHAKAALSLNGKLEIAGRVIKVSAVTDHIGVQDAGTNATDFDDEDGGGFSLNARSRAILMQKLDRTGTASSIAESLGVPVLNGVTPLPINGQTAMPMVHPVLSTPSLELSEPTECILLQNMFDPRSEANPDFDEEIKEDVQEECSKFGHVKHIYVDKNSNGWVYLYFENVAAASNCQKAMHGRWFAGRSIIATYMRPQDYEAKFGRGI